MKTKLLIAICLIVNSAYGQTLQANIFASGFDSPVGIANCGDDRLFVVERAGKIIVVNNNGTKLPTPFLDIDSIVSNGNDERGLLGLAFDPDYSNNGFFYVYFIDNSGNSQLARYNRNPADNNLAMANSKQIVLSVTQPVGFTNHKGGNLVFGPDGYLYCGLGDGGDSGDPLDNSQNPQSLLGKLIRIDVSSLPYSIPPSNPFVGAAPMDEIWALGLRNPWRWSFDRITNDLWIADVGQGNWEEINFQPAYSNGGENYGWRCYEGHASFNTNGCAPMSSYVFPVYDYPHSGPNSGCSATGGFVYRGTQYNSLFGKYLFSDYCSGNIWSLDDSYNFNDYGTFGFGMSSFGEDINGELYLANVSNGNVYSIATNECNPVAYITNPDTSYLCTSPIVLQALQGPGLTYQWLRNGFPIPGGTNATYSPNVASNYQVVVTNQAGCSTTSNIHVVINNKPPAVIVGPNNFCIGQTAQINASLGTGFTYQWKYKNVDIPGATLSNYNATAQGTYRVLVTNSLGCTRLSNPFLITGPPFAGTDLNGNSPICIGDSIEIAAKVTNQNYTYKWLKNGSPIPGAVSNNYFISTQGFYQLNVTNQFGCSRTGTGKAVLVMSCLRSDQYYQMMKYNLYSIDGKLISSNRFSGTEQDLINYLHELIPDKKGIYILNIFDENNGWLNSIKVAL